MLYKIDFYAGETLKNKSTSTRENACRGTRLVGIVRFERTHEGVKDPFCKLSEPCLRTVSQLVDKFCDESIVSLFLNTHSRRSPLGCLFYIELSSSRKSIKPIFRTPLSSYQRFLMSFLIITFGKLSPVREKGFSSCAAFSSSGRAKAD